MFVDKPVICLMGPTASGKTDAALALAESFPVELISVDSVMIYRGMDIGSAKPSPEGLKQYPHHLIDILDPPEPYSAARFVKEVDALIQGSFKKGKIPLLVGGTMLYFHALQQGLSPLPEGDETVRAEIEREGAEKGWGAMHDLLAKVDAESAKRIHPNDPQRLGRALEVYRLTGVAMSVLLEQKGAKPTYAYVNLGLFPKRRDWLHERIATRFAEMLDQGLVEEVEALLKRWPDARFAPAMRAVGYRQVIDYLEGRIDKDALLTKGIIATRQLAKRQCTWLRTWPDIQLFDSEEQNMLERLKEKLKDIE